MGQPAAKQNDQITGQCAGHQIPGPTGSPVPAPPLPFMAPVQQGVDTSVMIEKLPAVVEGCTGVNTSYPPLHASDPYFVVTTQEGRVVMGSSTVKVGGKGLAHGGAQVTMCFNIPGQLMATASTVLVGP